MLPRVNKAGLIFFRGYEKPSTLTYGSYKADHDLGTILDTKHSWYTDIIEVVARR